MNRPPLPLRNYSWGAFPLEPNSPQGHSAAGRIMSIKNFNLTIGIRTRDLPVCSAVQADRPRNRGSVADSDKRRFEFHSFPTDCGAHTASHSRCKGLKMPELTTQLLRVLTLRMCGYIPPLLKLLCGMAQGQIYFYRGKNVCWKLGDYSDGYEFHAFVKPTASSNCSQTPATGSLLLQTNPVHTLKLQLRSQFRSSLRTWQCVGFSLCYAL